MIVVANGSEVEKPLSELLSEGAHSVCENPGDDQVLCISTEASRFRVPTVYHPTRVHSPYAMQAKALSRLDGHFRHRLS